MTLQVYLCVLQSPPGYPEPVFPMVVGAHDVEEAKRLCQMELELVGLPWCPVVHVRYQPDFTRHVRELIEELFEGLREASRR